MTPGSAAAADNAGSSDEDERAHGDALLQIAKELGLSMTEPAVAANDWHAEAQGGSADDAGAGAGAAAQERRKLPPSAHFKRMPRRGQRATKAHRTERRRTGTPRVRTQDLPITASHRPMEVSAHGAPLLPTLDQPDAVPAHRAAPDAMPGKEMHMPTLLRSSHFNDKFAAFLAQLTAWGYVELTPSGRALTAPKNALNDFARQNPDLLYALAPRELHIFAKKFKPFPRRELNRKHRAAAARLMHMYADFHMQPDYNGNPLTQDAVRLLHFVSEADFRVIEDKAPGIVAAANDLIQSMALAAQKPPAAEHWRKSHSADWVALREHVLGERQARATHSAQRRSMGDRRGRCVTSI